MRHLNMSDCQLPLSAFMAHGIYQMETIKSPEHGISLRAQVDSKKMYMSEACCSMYWAGTWHQGLFPWGEHLTHVICLILNAVPRILHWVLTLQMGKLRLRAMM